MRALRRGLLLRGVGTLRLVVVDKDNCKASVPRGSNVGSEIGLRGTRIERIGAEDPIWLGHADRSEETRETRGRLDVHELIWFGIQIVRIDQDVGDRDADL